MPEARDMNVITYLRDTFEKKSHPLSDVVVGDLTVTDLTWSLPANACWAGSVLVDGRLTRGGELVGLIGPTGRCGGRTARTGPQLSARLWAFPTV